MVTTPAIPEDDPRPQYVAGPENTVYPVNVGALQWALRYGSVAAVMSDRLITASVVSCYASLIDPQTTQTEAIASLKRARRAQRDLLASKED